MAVNAVSGKSVLSGTTSLSPRSNTMGRLTSVRMQNVISRLRSRCPTSAVAIAEGRNWRALRGLTEKGYLMGKEKSPKWACTCEGWNRPRAIPQPKPTLDPFCKFQSIAMAAGREASFGVNCIPRTISTSSCMPRKRSQPFHWEAALLFVVGLAGADASSRRVGIQLPCDMGGVLVFPSKRAESAHLTTMAKRFREARVKAGLPEDLVLYCGRHEYGTRILNRTGNLACRHENHGTQGCEDCDAVSTSRTRDRARRARSGHSSRETGVVGLSYGTLYGTPKTSTPVSD